MITVTKEKIQKDLNALLQTMAAFTDGKLPKNGTHINDARAALLASIDLREKEVLKHAAQTAEDCIANGVVVLSAGEVAAAVEKCLEEPKHQPSG